MRLDCGEDFKHTTCVSHVCACVCVSVGIYLYEPVFTCHVSDISLVARKICSVDCISDPAIRLKSSPFPCRASFSESVSVCDSTWPGHLWDVWLLRRSWACFNFNWPCFIYIFFPPRCV